MYSYEDIRRRIISGEFRSLGLEAIRLYHEADHLFNFDPDFPAMLSQMAADGVIEPLSREQIRALIALMLAVVARMENPSADGVGPDEERTNLPGSSTADVPEAFRKGLSGLDLESL